MAGEEKSAAHARDLCTDCALTCPSFGRQICLACGVLVCDACGVGPAG